MEGKGPINGIKGMEGMEDIKVMEGMEPMECMFCNFLYTFQKAYFKGNVLGKALGRRALGVYGRIGSRLH